MEEVQTPAKNLKKTLQELILLAIYNFNDSIEHQ